MHLSADDFRASMHPDVWDAVQHFRQTGVVEWTPPPGTPGAAEEPSCLVCRDMGRLAVREPGVLPRYVDCSACGLAVNRMLSKIDPDFRKATLDHFMQAARTDRAMEIGSFVADWARDGVRESCLLLGDYGALKTTLATAAWRYRVEHRIATSAEWIVAPDFLEELRHSYDADSGVLTSIVFDRAQATDLLLFDDLGAEKVTDRNRDWVQEQIYRLVNWRSNHLLPTLFTSNLSLKQLEAKLGRAIVSRIEGMCGPRIWVLDQGIDFRRVPL
jgi:DNA replication protein DnaC